MTIWRRTFLCLTLGLSLSFSALAEPAPTSRSALAALNAGKIEDARRLALAAISANPKDSVALSTLSAINVAADNPTEARNLALRSFRLADGDDAHFVAARLVAKATRDLGRQTSAQLWLRRALHYAPSTAAKQSVMRDYQILRQTNPLRFDLNLMVAPSDNVNRGGEDVTLTIDGRPTNFTFNSSTLALPGTEARLSLGVRYRLSGNQQSGTELGLNLRHSAVALNNRARRIAPDAKSKDFSSTSVDVMLFRNSKLSDSRLLRTGVIFGQSWQAGDPYAQFLRVELALNVSMNKKTTLRLSASAQRQWQTAKAAHASAFVVDAAAERALASGDRLGMRLSLGTTTSDDANQENTRIAAEVRYQRAEPIAGIKLSAGIGLAARDFPVFFNGVFNDSGREDLTLSSSLDLALPKVTAFGFEPVISLEGNRTRSNISRFDTKSFGVGMRIQSSF